MPEADLLDRYRTFDTSVVSDALDHHGVDGVIDGVEPAAGGGEPHAAGYARPVQLARVRGDEATNFPHAMLAAMEPDDAVVVSGVGPTVSCWGGNACRLAANAGVAGVVVDGGYRDVAEVRAEAFPLFGAAPTPRSGQHRVRVSATDEPVTVDGVRVAPGDVVVADATGVVVVPADDAAAVADTAADLRDAERELEAAIDDGATVEDLRDREF
ncbi:MAG: RraA family protein [Haloferacaceae archaeon]